MGTFARCCCVMVKNRRTFWQELLFVFVFLFLSRLLRYHRHTPIHVLLNKTDLFEEMIREVPLSVCFPEYSGPPEQVLPAISFVEGNYRIPGIAVCWVKEDSLPTCWFETSSLLNWFPRFFLLLFLLDWNSARDLKAREIQTKTQSCVQ